MSLLPPLLGEVSPLQFAGILALLYICKIILSFYTHDFNPSRLPLVGVPPGFLGRLRAIPDTFSRPDKMLEAGINLYQAGKQPSAFLAPWQLNKYIHILPASLVPELKAAPENVLSLIGAFEEEMGSFTFGDEAIGTHPYHIKLVRQKLTTTFDSFVASMEEEADLAFKEDWEDKWAQRLQVQKSEAEGGADTGGWVEVKIFEEAMNIVSRVTNRAFVGPPICHDKAFLKNSRDYSVGILLSGWAMQIFPVWSRRYIAPIFTFRNRGRISFATKRLAPHLEKRKAIIEHNLKNPDDRLEEPSDMLQFLMQDARELGPPHYNDESLSIRYLVLNFVAMHTTTLAFTNALINAAAYSPSGGGQYWEILRDEVLMVDRLSEEGPAGVWTKKKLNKLVGMDSFIRETLRFHMVAAAALVRKVMAKEGYTFSNGLHIKHGELVGVPAISIHTTDESSGDNPMEFQGFRFSKPYHVLLDEGASASDITFGGTRLSAVTTTDRFLTFGHGKHACPGRFFAINEVKMLLKYCVLNHELHSIEKRPSRNFIWVNQAPPLSLKLQLRKRKEVHR